MESMASLVGTIMLQVSVIFLTGLSWVYAAFKLAHADGRNGRRTSVSSQ